MFDKELANPNYIPVYMKVYYLFTLCLFKVGRLFSKLAIPKYMFVLVIKLSKEKTYFMYGWTWEIEHKMYCLLLTWVSVWDSAPYFHCSVSNVNFVLWRGVQKYFLYARMSIKCVECAITEIYLLLVASLLVARNWSLAWAWYGLMIYIYSSICTTYHLE